MKTKLKPCPFCGGRARLERCRIADNASIYWVHCLTCKAQTETVNNSWANTKIAKAKAIAAWNRRVS